MIELAWTACGLAPFVALLVMLCAHKRSSEVSSASAERDSRPEALFDAELIHVEKLFRMSRPVHLIAKVDRAYRTPTGVVVLVEFKSRWINRPFVSDVIQLSAQKAALEGQTQLRGARHGYVVVKTPSKAAVYTAHRVELMSKEDVIALIRRREDILSNRVEPRYAAAPNVCRTCSFRPECGNSRPRGVTQA